MVKCGIAGWVDRSLIESGRFYPKGVGSSEERLQYYASQFGLVEVDSTFHGMPPRRSVERWAERTPAGFTFDVKAFALFTQHPTKLNRLLPELREGVPAELHEKNLYQEALPPETVDAAWEAFRETLEPLRAAGRLGVVLFQFPPWFLPSSKSLAYLEEVQERMTGFTVAVEFRKAEWLDERHRSGTLTFLRSLGLALVAVDVPQGFPTSLPPVAEATSERLAVVRFHGRNSEKWQLRGAPPWVKFRYLYSEAELGEWVPRIRELEEHTAEVHVVMNNNYADWSVQGARTMERLLAGG